MRAFPETEKFEVSVVTGKVSVTNDSEKEVFVTPKQQVVLTRDGQMFVRSEINARKRMLNDKFSKFLIKIKVTDLLKTLPIMKVFLFI